MVDLTHDFIQLSYSSFQLKILRRLEVECSEHKDDLKEGEDGWSSEKQTEVLRPNERQFNRGVDVVGDPIAITALVDKEGKAQKVGNEDTDGHEKLE